MQQGPKEVVIPEQRILTCTGCEFYTHRMVKSGHNPIYADHCNHDIASFKNTFICGNLSLDKNKLPIPGDWCVFNKKKDELQKTIH